MLLRALAEGVVCGLFVAAHAASFTNLWLFLPAYSLAGAIVFFISLYLSLRTEKKEQNKIGQKTT